MLNIRTTFAVLLLVVFASVTQAQSLQERSAQLHSLLAQVQNQQTDLQNRLQELNEQIKPENIEKSYAGVGSTHPEDLRELRRRQLASEKTLVEKQLGILNDSRIKLEAAISQTDALFYQQSAQPATSSMKVGFSSESSSRARQTPRKKVRARRVNR